MPSKMITDRQKAAAELSGTVFIYAPKASAVLQRMFETDLHEGEQVPDLVFFQKLLGRRLSRLRTQLTEVDNTHRAEIRDDRKLRESRNVAAEELRQSISRIRKIVDGAYGAGTCARYLDVDGRIPKDPVVLHRVAEVFVKELRSGNLEEAGTTLPGVNLDVNAWADHLEGPTLRLGEILGQLTQERPETRDRQTVKAAAMTDYDNAYLATARIVENLFRYAGMIDRAEKIRPGGKSPAKASEEVEAEIEPEIEAESDSPDFEGVAV